MSVDKSVHALNSTFAAFATTGLECFFLLTVLDFSNDILLQHYRIVRGNVWKSVEGFRDTFIVLFWKYSDRRVKRDFTVSILRYYSI